MTRRKDVALVLAMILVLIIANRAVVKWVKARQAAPNQSIQTR